MTDDNTTLKLMLKRHLKTGKLYLCYTKKNDYMVYLGSGKHWIRHLKKHGNKIYTLLLAEYPMSKKKEFNSYCRWMSKVLNVVDDDNFANLCEERGDEGGIWGMKFTPETRKKMSASKSGENHPLFGKNHTSETCAQISTSLSGRKLSSEHRSNISDSMSGENHPLYRKIGENHPSFGKKHTPESREKMSASMIGKGNHYWITTPHGEVVYVEGISPYCREHGLNDSLMAKVARGKRKHHKGYTAKFVTEEERRKPK